MNEHYKALTRAYRPQTFDDIVSQDHVSSTLRNAIRNNRLSHAYMFCGPRGVGKTTMARVLAREVNQVDRGVDGEALGSTLNIVEIDAASNRKIEDIRSLKEVIRVPPQNGRYKIFIIDEVHMLTKEAFNALLKTLEEPPEHAIFIFATTEPHKVLPTILSRVQRFDFKRIAVEEIVSRLRSIADREGITIDDESLHVIARRADGALRDALGLMDQAIAFCGNEIRYQELLKALNVVGVEELFRFTALVKERDAASGLVMIDELIRAGTDIQEFLASLTEHLRNLYVATLADRLYLVEATEETRQRYRTHAPEFGEQDLLRMMHQVSETQQKLKDSQQPRVQFEILFLKLAHMNRARDLGTLLSEIQELKKKAGNGELIPAGTADGNTSGEVRRDRSNYSEMSTVATEPADVPKPDELRKSRIESSEHDAPEKPRLSESPSERAGSEGSVAQPSGAEASEEEELFGRPSIGLPPAGKPSAAGNVTETPLNGPDPELQSQSEPVRAVTVEEVRASWPVVLQELEKSAPRTLYFQMERIEIAGLKGRELQVKAENEFAIRLVEENQPIITQVLRRVLGNGFRMSCQVVRSREQRAETVSPYERFKQLQKKDPHLRTLVDLFGAELEY